MNIRLLNKKSQVEIDLVAQRMRSTLVDVLGEQKGTDLYSIEWLRERVNWHLDENRIAAVYLAEESDGEISGQAIVRIEKDEFDNEFAFFSTIYVAPEFRNRGIAKNLIEKVEDWSTGKRANYITYNTAENNQKIIKLFESRGYGLVLNEDKMVKLKKSFCSDL